MRDDTEDFEPLGAAAWRALKTIASARRAGQAGASNAGKREPDGRRQDDAGSRRRDGGQDRHEARGFEFIAEPLGTGATAG